LLTVCGMLAFRGETEELADGAAELELLLVLLLLVLLLLVLLLVLLLLVLLLVLLLLVLLLLVLLLVLLLLVLLLLLADAETLAETEAWEDVGVGVALLLVEEAALSEA
jgi:hypothetical protein